MKNKTDTQLLQLKMLSPEKTLYEGMVSSVTCHNPKGTFDILYQHTNFMSMIDHEVVIIDPTNKKQVFQIENALINVQDNVVTILVDVHFSEKETLLQKLFHRK